MSPGWVDTACLIATILVALWFLSDRDDSGYST